MLHLLKALRQLTDFIPAVNIEYRERLAIADALGCQGQLADVTQDPAQHDKSQHEGQTDSSQSEQQGLIDAAGDRTEKIRTAYRADFKPVQSGTILVEAIRQFQSVSIALQTLHDDLTRRQLVDFERLQHMRISFAHHW